MCRVQFSNRQVRTLGLLSRSKLQRLNQLDNFYRVRMKTFITLILVATALHSFYITSNYSVTRIASIVLFSGYAITALYIQSIGSDTGFYSCTSLVPDSSLMLSPIFYQIRTLTSKASKKVISKPTKFSGWNSHVVTLDQESLITKPLLMSEINKFWDSVVNKIESNNHILLLFKIKFNSGQIRTLGKMQQLNPNDKNYLVDFLGDVLQRLEDSYSTTPIIQIIFYYGIREGEAKSKEITHKVPFQNHYHFKLPITFDPFEYGTVLASANNVYTIHINNTNTAILTTDGKVNDVKIFRAGNLMLEYTDTLINEKTFVRKIGNSEFTYTNGELVLVTTPKRTRSLTTLKTETSISNKILTLDTETRVINSVHQLYLISFFDGAHSQSFFSTDFKTQEDLIIAAMQALMVKKYDNHKVYVHNLANFDSVFLFKTLSKIGTIKPIIHKGNLISFTFKYNGYIITFKDSYQILPVSLKRLTLAFNVLNKSFFPHNFTNLSSTSLNYIGGVPDIKFFSGITASEYEGYSNNFKANNWNLREEAIKYCQIDCVSLYQVLVKFNELIFNLFNVNIEKYPTISSLAFAIFRTKFLQENSICQIAGEMYHFIQKAYTGGSVNMYIPKGLKLFGYDINSLYPFVMRNNYLPVGNPVYFKGNIRAKDPKAFGYFKVKVTTPSSLIYPVIQLHVKTKDGVRTIAPLGTFTTTLFSPEMDNAVKFGYRFEILEGYTFEKAIIFESYVDQLYKLRLEYSKDNPLNLVSKLLLNSLYGRFGMSDSFTSIKVMNQKEYAKFEPKNINSILDVTPIGDKYMVETFSQKREDIALTNPEKQVHNVNIAIAAAIPAYGRMHMFNVMYELHKLGIKVYYMDTDSLYTDKPIPDYLISQTELGKFKLEHNINKAIFLAPKVYALETDKGEHIFKVKGLTSANNLNMEDFEALLVKDSYISQSHILWFKSMLDSNISVREQLYTLKVTNNKRQLI